MPQAIVTKYYGPTNTRGSRIKATSASGKSLTLPWAYELGVDENHAAAAVALAQKLGWEGRFVMGGLADGAQVFVDAGGPSFAIGSSNKAGGRRRR